MTPEGELSHGMSPELWAKDGFVYQELILSPLVEPVLTSLEKEKEDIDTRDVFSHGGGQVLDESCIPPFGVRKPLSI